MEYPIDQFNPSKTPSYVEINAVVKVDGEECIVLGKSASSGYVNRIGYWLRGNKTVTQNACEIFTEQTLGVLATYEELEKMLHDPSVSSMRHDEQRRCYVFTVRLDVDFDAAQRRFKTILDVELDHLSSMCLVYNDIVAIRKSEIESHKGDVFQYQEVTLTDVYGVQHKPTFSALSASIDTLISKP
jgi:hypothetical protein